MLIETLFALFTRNNAGIFSVSNRTKSSRQKFWQKVVRISPGKTQPTAVMTVIFCNDTGTFLFIQCQLAYASIDKLSKTIDRY